MTRKDKIILGSILGTVVVSTAIIIPICINYTNNKEVVAQLDKVDLKGKGDKTLVPTAQDIINELREHGKEMDKAVLTEKLTALKNFPAYTMAVSHWTPKLQDLFNLGDEVKDKQSIITGIWNHFFGVIDGITSEE